MKAGAKVPAFFVCLRANKNPCHISQRSRGQKKHVTRLKGAFGCKSTTIFWHCQTILQKNIFFVCFFSFSHLNDPNERPWPYSLQTGWCTGGRTLYLRPSVFFRVNGWTNDPNDCANHLRAIWDTFLCRLVICITMGAKCPQNERKWGWRTI